MRARTRVREDVVAEGGGGVGGPIQTCQKASMVELFTPVLRVSQDKLSANLKSSEI